MFFFVVQLLLLFFHCFALFVLVFSYVSGEFYRFLHLFLRNLNPYNFHISDHLDSRLSGLLTIIWIYRLCGLIVRVRVVPRRTVVGDINVTLMSPTTVLLGTTLTRTIKPHKRMRLLGSNHLPDSCVCTINFFS